jgi:hypothetical protein
MWSTVKVLSGIYLTSSLRLTRMRPYRTAPTHNTAPPLVSMETPADSRAQTDSRLLRPATRLHAHAMRLRSTAMVSAWLQEHAPQARHFLRRRGGEAGLAAALAQTWDLDGWPAASSEVGPAHGSASTLLMILKAVSSSFLAPRCSAN